MAPSHPPYIDMITEALVSLNERTGSSHYAIAKHIEERQKVRDLPPNLRRLLFVQLKKFVASGKLVKVKNSFKLPPTAGKKKALKKMKAVMLKSPAKKVAPVKVRKLKSITSPAKKPAVTRKAKK